MTLPADEKFTLELGTQGGVPVLELAGELDLLAAPLLAAEVGRLAEAGITEIVVDASGLGFIDVAGYRALVNAREIVHGEGSRFHLVPSPAVRRLLDLLGQDSPFVMFVSVNDATRAISDDRE